MLFGSFRSCLVSIHPVLSNGSFPSLRFTSFICSTRIWTILPWFFHFALFIYGMLITSNGLFQPDPTTPFLLILSPIFTASSHHRFHLSRSSQNLIIFSIFLDLVQDLRFFFSRNLFIFLIPRIDLLIFAKINKTSLCPYSLFHNWMSFPPISQWYPYWYFGFRKFFPWWSQARSTTDDVPSQCALQGDP